MKKRLIQIFFSFLLLLLVVVGSLLFNTPLRRTFLLHTDKKTNARLDQAFQEDRLTVISHEVEIRFSPGMVTGKSIIEYEAGTDLSDFQPFILHNGFVFDSIKQNGKNLHFEKWFTCGQVTFWKVYPKFDEGREETGAFCLLYTGAISRKDTTHFFSPDQFWYPRTPGMCQDGQIDLFKCIVDQDWMPVFSGVLDSVTEVKDGVNLYEFISTNPVSAAMLQIGKTQEIRNVEMDVRVDETNEQENTSAYTYAFYRTAVADDLFLLLMEKTMGVTGYFRNLFGDLPRRDHVFLFNPDVKFPGDTTLYYTALNLGGRAGRKGRDVLLSPELEDRLLEKIAGIWWGGTVLSSCEKGEFLSKSLARYAGYLAFSELCTPEEAGRILEEWYQKYLAALKRFKHEEKALADIYHLWDTQRDLASYKSPLIWHALRFHLGEEAFVKLLREFFATYQGRVGTWEGLRELAVGISRNVPGGTVENEVGENETVENGVGESETEGNNLDEGNLDGGNLDWFFDYFLYSNARLDLQVRQVIAGGNEEGMFTSRIIVGCPRATEESRYEFRGRVLLRVETAEEEREVIVCFPVDGGEVVVETAGPPLVVSLDPEEWWPDIDRSNNEWRLNTDTADRSNR